MNKDVQEWKLKEVLKLVGQYSRVYIIKFIALVCLAIMSTIVLPNDHYGLLVTSLTFVSSLLFDQITNNKLSEDFDFQKIGNLCNMGIVYIAAIFIIVLSFFIAENQIAKNVPLVVCRIIMFILSFVASFSALIEGVSNLPPQILPSQQERVENK